MQLTTLKRLIENIKFHFLDKVSESNKSFNDIFNRAYHSVYVNRHVLQLLKIFTQFIKQLECN